MTLAAAFYLRLPPPLQDLAAAAHGARLRWWRYGAEYSRLVPELCARAHWSRERWEAYARRELTVLLEHALRTVPYYRARYAPGTPLPELGVLEKSQARLHAEELVSEQFKRSKLYPDHTSGSTGAPLPVYLDRLACQAVYAHMEARVRRPAGVRWGEPWAMLGGQYVVPTSRREPPYWVWSRPYHQLYLSVYHLSASTVPHYLSAMRKRGVTHLYGYGSALHSLAVLAEPEEARALGLTAIFSNGEALPQASRELISEVFGARVWDTYGMAEAVALGSECALGRMHLWPDYGHVEVLEGTDPVEPGQVGDLVATGLVNRAMPFVRYRTGDRIALDPEPCACSWHTPVVARIEGRTDDVIRTPHGRRVTFNATAIGKWSRGVGAFQVVQDRPDHLTLRVQPAAGYQPVDGEYLLDRVRDRAGAGLSVTLELVPEIPRTPAGKVRVVVSRLEVPPGGRGP